jgi:hypothetical protein
MMGMILQRWRFLFFLAVLGPSLWSCVSANSARPTPYAKYPITVDYGQSVEDLIKSGSYRWTYSELSSRNFPPQAAGTKQLSATLVRIRGESTIDQVVAAEAKDGFRPATIQELLAFGDTYPEMIKNITIAGLGSQKEYIVVIYDRLGIGSEKVDISYKPERFFPSFSPDLFGLSFVMIQEDMIPSLNPGGFYGCFVTEE